MRNEEEMNKEYKELKLNLSEEEDIDKPLKHYLLLLRKLDKHNKLYLSLLVFYKV